MNMKPFTKIALTVGLLMSGVFAPTEADAATKKDNDTEIVYDNRVWMTTLYGEPIEVGVYEVIKGDTLNSIGRKFGAIAMELLELNPTQQKQENPYLLKIGQKLVVPTMGESRIEVHVLSVDTKRNRLLIQTTYNHKKMYVYYGDFLAKSIEGTKTQKQSPTIKKALIDGTVVSMSTIINHKNGTRILGSISLE